eukprot:TRINITY_DN11986_c0_g1_i2.p2 TRINITY_DN11986_c0_g1~~TRINITY_DN11986_c0_g1_i2.p2  ORF type:complete len:103 (+),score=21.52 TRINITY_DN11986_c0_g1_i2:58-366(+)
MGHMHSREPPEFRDLREALHPAERRRYRPGCEADYDTRGRQNYGRHGRALLPESMDPDDLGALSTCMDHQQTYCSAEYVGRVSAVGPLSCPQLPLASPITAR